jgi:hypothetical protein
MRRWTRGRQRLCALGVVCFVLALERLANAALLNDPSRVSVALGFSVTLGLIGALTLIGAGLRSMDK